MAAYLSKSEFSRAVAMVQKDDERINCFTFMQSTTFNKFEGFGLYGFEPVTCTLIELANLIAYQCNQFNGEMDMEAMDEIWQNRRRFLVVGEGSDEVIQRQHDVAKLMSVFEEVGV